MTPLDDSPAAPPADTHALPQEAAPANATSRGIPRTSEPAGVMTPASGTCDETPARATTPAATTPAATTPAATTPAATTPAATTPAAIKAVITTPQAEAAGLETETKRSTDGDSTPNSYQAEKSELANAKAELVGELEPLEQPELANAKAELVGESEPLEQPELATAKAELVGESEPLEQPELAAAPAERASEVVQVNLASRAAYRLTWCLTLLGFLLVLVSGLPLLVEELQYRLERGRLRARVESAGRWLDQAPLGEFSRASEMVSQRVGPSVVHINIADESGEEEAAARDRAGSENLLDENGLPRRRPRRRLETGQGSGVVMDSEGHIVTNRHVIEDAKRIEVVLSDGRRRPAIIVGVDEPTDIAVLKVDAPGVFAAEWGDSDSLEVGALVWAVGSPFGLERSITFGILSAKNRAGLAGTPFQDLMQSDAAVNPGNSGGPLVDAQGRVVGINTAIVGAAYQGVSFAIPSQVAERVYRDLKTRGVVARGWLGIEPQTVDEQLARELGLTAEQRGALVRRLADVPLGEDLPARSAGIRLGDVIQSWNGRMVETADGLIANVSQTPVGEKVPVMVLRDGEQLELEVTVGRRPPTPR